MNECLSGLVKIMPDEEIQVLQALEIIVRYGNIDGSHHKAWCLDQVARLLAGEKYNEMVAWANDGEDGPDSYAWDIGIAP